MEAPTQAIVAVIHAATQPHPGILQQVTLRPDKVKAVQVQQGDRMVNSAIIRLGETPQDEYMGWMRLQDIEIICVLGKAVEQPDKTWKCIPED